MAQSQAAYGGSLGARFRLVLDANEISVDNANNRSLVQVSVWMTCVQNAGRVYNLGTTYGNLNTDGNVIGTALGGYDFNPGVGAVKYLVQNYQQWVGHNGDGTKTIGLSAYHNADAGSFVTTGSVSLTLGLTNIPRYAGITGLSLQNVSDVGFDIQVNTNATCDILSYSLDNGATFNDVSGAFTSKAITIGDLRSGTQYNVKVNVRRQDSGLWTNSGTVSATTRAQSSFIGLL